MTIQQGDRLPSSKVYVMQEGKPALVDIGDITAGKKVVLFSVTGAFTTTCSNTHLPSFVVQADAIMAKGVDEIMCIAVNDPFVMDSWGKSANADAITMIGDGNAEFSSALELTLDASRFGMEVRSMRYAMVIEDGVVTHLAVDEPGKLEVSHGEAVLAAL